MAGVSRLAGGSARISERALDKLLWKVASWEADKDFLALAGGYVGSSATVGIFGPRP